MENKKILSNVVMTALFAAFICVGCFIQIPLPGGIPIVIQDMMAMLSGLILGPLYGTCAVLVFLIIGSIGLPVFSGKAGFQVIYSGPTGGFLIGYMAAAFVGGLILFFALPKNKENSKAKQWIFISIAALLATVTAFVFGILGFHRVLPNKTMKEVLAAVLIPFIPGNLVKLVVMVPVTYKLRKIISNFR